MSSQWQLQESNHTPLRAFQGQAATNADQASQTTVVGREGSRGDTAVRRLRATTEKKGHTTVRALQMREHELENRMGRVRHLALGHESQQLSGGWISSPEQAGTSEIASH